MNMSVPTPGTPVRITSLVDSSGLNAPETATATGVAEYTRRFQKLMFQGFHLTTGGSAHGLSANTGLVYIVRYGDKGAGSGNHDDPGVIVAVIASGATFWLISSASNNDVWSHYRYYLDADTANDGAIVTGFVQ